GLILRWLSAPCWKRTNTTSATSCANRLGTRRRRSCFTKNCWSLCRARTSCSRSLHASISIWSIFTSAKSIRCCGAPGILKVWKRRERSSHKKSRKHRKNFFVFFVPFCGYSSPSSRSDKISQAMRAARIGIPLAALGAALFIFGGLMHAADTSIPIYFPNSKLIVKAETFNRATYVPIKEIIEFMGVPYTDALALETLTLRSGNSRLLMTKNSALMSYNNQILLLPSPILREEGRWLAPIEFLAIGLTRLTGTEFRYRPGTPRIFADNVDSPELEMIAQTLGPVTRLTLRCSVPLKLDLKRDNQRAILAMDRPALDPVRERLDHRDRMVRSIAFDDSDGDAKIVLDLTRDVTDMRLTAADNNRVFFLDLLTKKEPVTEAAPPPVVTPAPAAKPDVIPAQRKVRV